MLLLLAVLQWRIAQNPTPNNSDADLLPITNIPIAAAARRPTQKADIEK